MIVGHGHDLVDIRRIEKLIEAQGERFLKRCFTEEEVALAERRREGGLYSATLAKRFAAKEACAKALGCGVGAMAAMHEIGVIRNGNGKPDIALAGEAAERLKSLLPDGMKARLHLSLSDEYPYASASVIIEAF